MVWRVMISTATHLHYHMMIWCGQGCRFETKTNQKNHTPVREVVSRIKIKVFGMYIISLISARDLKLFT